MKLLSKKVATTKNTFVALNARELTQVKGGVTIPPIELVQAE